MLVCSTPSLSLLYSKTKYDSALQKFDSALQKNWAVKQNQTTIEQNQTTIEQNQTAIEQNIWCSLDLILVEQTPTSVEQTKFSPLYFVEQIQAMVVEQNNTIA